LLNKEKNIESKRKEERIGGGRRCWGGGGGDVGGHEVSLVTAETEMLDTLSIMGKSLCKGRIMVMEHDVIDYVYRKSFQ